MRSVNPTKVTGLVLPIFFLSISLPWVVSSCSGGPQRSARPLLRGEKRRPPPPAATEDPQTAGGTGVRAVRREFYGKNQVEIELLADAGSSSEGAYLWVTADGGRTWRFAGETNSINRPIIFGAEDGKYGFTVRPRPKGGGTPEPPEAGEPPDGTAVIDAVPPEIETDAVGIAPGEGKPPSRSLDLQLPYRVRDLHMTPSGLKFEWRAHGRSWTSVPGMVFESLSGEVKVNLPRPSGDSVIIRIVAVDLAGNVSTRMQTVPFVDLLDPPRLEFLSFHDGGTYRGGAQSEVRFKLDWPRLAAGGLSLSVSSDGGRTWQPVASGIDPGAPYVWSVPALDSTSMVLELAARGAGGFRSVARTPPFRIDSQPPLARILGPRYSAPRNIRLSVWARDAGPAGIDRLVLYATTSSGGVRKVGEYPPGETIDFEADREGEIGLYLVGIDKAGNGGPVPSDGESAPFILEVDAREPALWLDSFSSGGVYRGGARLYAFLRGEPALQDRPLSLHLSEGPDGTWRPIAEGLTFRERILWTLPETTGEGFRLKVEVQDRRGTVVRAVSREPFAIDSTPPRVRIEAAESIGARRIRLYFRGVDEPAGLARVRFWHRLDPGLPTSLFATSGAAARSGLSAWEEILPPVAVEGEEPAGTREVDLPPGRYAFYAAGEDRVGNAGPPPERPEDAQAHAEAIGAGQAAEEKPSAAEPRLALTNFHEGIYRGGDRRYIFWAAEGFPSEGVVVDIDCSADGGASWSSIASEIPASIGKCAWTLPADPATARKVRLKLTARSGELRLHAESKADFTIDTRAPRIRLLGPAVSRSATTRVGYAFLTPENLDETKDAVPPAPVARVECYVRKAREAAWVLGARSNLDRGESRFFDEVELSSRRRSETALDANLSEEDHAADETAGSGGPQSHPSENEDTDAIAISLEDGRYELALVAVDAVGNHSPLPVDGGGNPGHALLVDTVRPRLRVSIPEKKDIYSGGEQVAIQIRAEDENLPEFPVWLETMSDSAPQGAEPASEWETIERYFPRDRTYAYRVPRSPGIRRLRITAADAAGNRAVETVSLRVAPPGPQVNFVGFERPRAVRSGDSIVVRWETQGIEPDARTVGLSSSRDGGRTWTAIADRLPNQGIFTWTAPAENIKDLRLRIEVSDAVGQVGSAISEAIAVSDRPPRVVLEAVEPAAPKAAERKETE